MPAADSDFEGPAGIGAREGLGDRSNADGDLSGFHQPYIVTGRQVERTASGTQIAQQAHMAKRFPEYFPLVLTLASTTAVVGAGCDITCDGGHWTKRPHPECDVSGSASLVAPERFLLPTTVPATLANNCLAGDNTCTVQPKIAVATPEMADGHQFWLSMTLPATTGAATYILPAPHSSPISVNAGISWSNSDVTPLDAVAGTIVVDHSTVEELHLTFAAELELQSTGERVSLTNGMVSLTQCHVAQMDYCEGGD